MTSVQERFLIGPLKLGSKLFAFPVKKKKKLKILFFDLSIYKSINKTHNSSKIFLVVIVQYWLCCCLVFVVFLVVSFVLTGDNGLGLQRSGELLWFWQENLPTHYRGV